MIATAAILFVVWFVGAALSYAAVCRWSEPYYHDELLFPCILWPVMLPVAAVIGAIRLIGYMAKA